jgi:hypothetical protein
MGGVLLLATISLFLSLTHTHAYVHVYPYGLQVSDQSLVGMAQSLAVQAVAQPVSLDMPTSHLAGALVTAGRKAAGLYPTWPKCLMVLTGLLNPQDAAPAQQLLTDLAAAEGASA